ncbi:MAG: SDR family oxidoreductase [Nitrospinaceae bacterium]|jgi:NAD(P)-dependent dehydrogenase (short-subunit alcohol dehydrogenase family)|nr:SDR family oxidoreductase [Nitrospinaceae bacterium]MBT3434257.1 SDR family oxidoreductase [Nitrospinaceae bacterium]MBT3819948.1 SDR family oxidoreductase [Nitrospinaceae bacterium]MBT4093717.1 SDR family oxidoreductase [Nitrospinaceae bacterium]MBT4430512.1 SDR family oxidoreductase [Nitrospinaceae bacterium]
MISIDLNGKVAIVTGASQGIGRGCAEWLARAGAAVALVARNAELLNEASSAIRSEGGTAETFVADLTESGKTEWVVKETIKRFGGLDILVNVAGASRRSDPTETSDEDIDLAIDTKLRAAVRLTRAAVPHIRSRGGGSIVFTGGSSQRQSTDFHGSGCIPNASLGAYKHHLAQTLAPEGIRVNLIVPGSTRTPRMEKGASRLAELSGKTTEEVMAGRMAAVPMGRMGTPDDCGKVVLFLVSDLSSFVTGESIGVDGGRCDVIRY